MLIIIKVISFFFKFPPLFSVKNHIIFYLRGDAISLEEREFSNIDNPHDEVSESEHQCWEEEMCAEHHILDWEKVHKEKKNKDFINFCVMNLRKSILLSPKARKCGHMALRIIGPR